MIPQISNRVSAFWTKISNAELVDKLMSDAHVQFEQSDLTMPYTKTGIEFTSFPQPIADVGAPVYFYDKVVPARIIR